MKTLRLEDGRTIDYEEWGDPRGAPLISLHGTPGCRLNRPAEEAKLQAAHVHLVTYDRPGYGGSDRCRGRAVADCVGDLEAVANACGFDRFALIGGSGGGPHALAAAAGLGGRVSRALCIVGVAPCDAVDLEFFSGMDPAKVIEFGWALEGEDRLAVELEREAREIGARVAQDPTRMLETYDLPDSDLATLADPRVQQVMRESTGEMFARGVGGWVDDGLAFTRPWGFDLSQISVPVEIRFGDSDVLVPAGHGRWLASHVPGATVTIDTGRGHMPNPDELIRLMVHIARGTA